MGKTWKDRRKRGFKARANFKGVNKNESKKYDEYKKHHNDRPRPDDKPNCDDWE